MCHKVFEVGFSSPYSLSKVHIIGLNNILQCQQYFENWLNLLEHGTPGLRGNVDL